MKNGLRLSRLERKQMKYNPSSTVNRKKKKGELVKEDFPVPGHAALLTVGCADGGVGSRSNVQCVT